MTYYKKSYWRSHKGGMYVLDFIIDFRYVYLIPTIKLYYQSKYFYGLKLRFLGLNIDTYFEELPF